MINFHFNAVTGLLIALVLLGYFGHNVAIAISALVLLIVQQTGLAAALPWINKNGINLGIIILTIGVLSPLVSGKVVLPSLKEFLDWKIISAIAVGVLVAWFGGRGVTLMKFHPTLITGLIIGTLIGVAFFRGVPVGPLIAAGMLSLFVSSSE
ncbi:DUF441 domain-containing protein [Taylorella asinigenitalis]|uniref:UPF0756 membrane protein TASI_1180 n=1 Tax=Taylorella asinigenitalis (strain MCE3) TaxID=1008459 RepID=G4QBF4_TAYAM|nr:DUF441 domain-containing protein [Taylorella asinigenitalis]AEP36932.1 putative membrane protein [Taylorella asinigenitalis MCE3]